MGIAGFCYQTLTKNIDTYYLRRQVIGGTTDVIIDVPKGIYMTKKKWYLSKTVWFNIIATAVAIQSAFEGSAYLAKVLPILGAFVTVGNIILRVWFTSSVISNSPESES